MFSVLRELDKSAAPADQGSGWNMEADMCLAGAKLPVGNGFLFPKALYVRTHIWWSGAKCPVPFRSARPGFSKPKIRSAGPTCMMID